MNYMKISANLNHFESFTLDYIVVEKLCFHSEEKTKQNKSLKKRKMLAGITHCNFKPQLSCPIF